MCNRRNSYLFLALVLLFAQSPGFAQEEPTPEVQDTAAAEEESVWSDTRHRLDFGLDFIDSEEFDSLSGILGYTYALGPKSNLGFEVSYLDSQLNEDGGSGIGDIAVTWSWVPFVPISVGPWVPRQVGSGISVSFPTGNADDGRSLDATVVTPFLGLVIPIGDSSFSLMPSFAYAYSTDAIITGEYIRIGIADLGVNWVSERGWWVSVFAARLKDYEADDTYENYALSVGTVFRSGWGMSVDFNDTGYFLPGSGLVGLGSSDRELAVFVHRNF